MKQNKKMSLHEEVKKEAEGIAQEVADNPKLEDVTVSESVDSILVEKIRIYDKRHAGRVMHDGTVADSNQKGEVEFAEELMPNFIGCTNDKLKYILSEEDQEALRLGREMLERGKREPLHKPSKEYHKHLNEPENRANRMRMPRKKKFVIALAAIMVLVIGMGVTSVGSKSYLKVLWDKVYGGQRMQVANVNDMDSKEIEDGEEVAALVDIREKLKVQAVRLRFKPKGMRLKEYEVNKEQGQAILFYNYENEVIRYYIYLNEEDSSLSQRETDDQIDEFTVKNDLQNIRVKEYGVNNSDKNRFIAEFDYKGVNYELKGVMEKTEMVEIVENLFYFQ